MNPKRVPPWLENFQNQFTTAIRTPLDRSTLTLRTNVDAYERHFAAMITAKPGLQPHEHLSAYNAQYWFRLFNVMQNEFPLVAGILGFWEFNRIAQDYLLTFPPEHYHINKIGQRFSYYVNQHEDWPTYIREAVLIDDAWNKAFAAADEPHWQWQPEHHQNLACLRLVPRQSFSIFRESYPLVALRLDLPDNAGESPMPPPRSHKEPQWWGLVRHSDGQSLSPLHPLQAKLLQLLGANSIGTAIAQLESECQTDEIAILERNIQGWLMDSVRERYWTQAVEAEEGL